MATFTQENRSLTVASGLGKDVLLLTAFTGREEMSRLFKFELELLSANDGIVASDVVGQPLTWAVHHIDRAPRYFNGYVNRFVAGGKSFRGLRSYRAEVVPWLWFLTRTANCKIFQNMSAAAIIEAVFDDLGFSDYRVVLTRSLRVRDYCVQYRETAFNFVSRLMEEEGLFYYFKHEDGKHTLTVADANSVHADCAEEEIEYCDGSLAPNHISAWEHQYEYRPGTWTQTDYNFETPSTSLLTTTNTVVKLPNIGHYEMFDYPGLYYKTADGNPLTRARIEEEETPFDVVTGAGTCCTMTAGGKFQLTRHDCAAEKNTYVLTGVQHSGSDPSYQMNGTPAFYRNTFTCIPAAVPFRPARSTPKPVVQGLQTAVVVGPKGDEIYTDKYGRVKVQFFWDRNGKRDENSSCWMRVAQVWAGKRWGASFWPRVGQEVVVDFLEGDPDRPLLTGSVYNAEQMPPYQGGGPDSKHASDNKVCGIKSNSTPGGQGFNEWRFDDAKGKEQVFLHAERNLDTRVKNDSMELVLHDRHLIVGAEKDGKKAGDQKELVLQDKHLHVKRHQEEQVEGNLKLTVGHGDADDGGSVDIVIEKEKKELIEQNSHLHVKKAMNVLVDGGLSEAVGELAQSVGGKAHLQVKGDRNEKVGGDQSLNVAGKLHQKVGGSHAVDAGEIHLKAGMKIIIEAGAQLSLKGPGGFIDIGPGGVTIQGKIVLINSGGAAGSGCGCSPNAPTGPAKAADAQQAKPADPTVADDSRSGSKSAPA